MKSGYFGESPQQIFEKHRASLCQNQVQPWPRGQKPNRVAQRSLTALAFALPRSNARQRRVRFAPGQQKGEKKKKKKKHLQSRKAAAAAAKARRSEARAGVAASEQQLNRTAEEPRLQVEKLKPNRSAAAGGTSQDESPANEHQPPAALVSAAACRAFRCSSVNPAAKYSGLESGSYLRLRRVSSTPSAVGF